MFCSYYNFLTLNTEKNNKIHSVFALNLKYSQKCCHLLPILPPAGRAQLEWKCLLCFSAVTQRWTQVGEQLRDEDCWEECGEGASLITSLHSPLHLHKHIKILNENAQLDTGRILFRILWDFMRLI